MNDVDYLPSGRTALLVVDLQNGFCHAEGTIGRAFGPDAVAIPASIIPTVVGLMEACRAAGVRIWATRQVHYPDDRSRQRRLFPSHLERNGVMGLCSRGSWDAELVDEIARAMTPDDEVIVKHRSSAFFGTNLELQLRIRDIQVLVIVGTTPSFCVDSTIRDAYARDFDVIVVSDAVADSDLASHEAVLSTVGRFHGAVVGSAELIERLGSTG
jgi:ureidoacrylate peracid hydrolase